MLTEGAEARSFEVPAVADGEITRLSLDSYLGEQIVVLAFYPGDFNPACGEQSDLAELDLFAMQPDVTVLAISPDTVYSHQQFATEYDLDATLCADTRNELAAAYGVRTEDEYGQTVPERAAFVIDLEGVVNYAWSTADQMASYDARAIQRAVADIGGNRTAVSRYRVGHAHYVEGRRGFTSAMAAMDDADWIVARSDFQRACEEFRTADDHFGTATRFVESDQLHECFERAGTKATALWQAADWLAEAADSFSSGNGEQGQAYRQDATAPLETARDIPDPIEPEGIEVEADEISLPADALETRTDSVMADIRDRLDGTAPAGGIDIDAGGGTEPTNDERTAGPDVGPAQRLREYAGVGMDIDAPTGAGDEQVADALQATHSEAPTDGDEQATDGDAASKSAMAASPSSSTDGDVTAQSSPGDDEGSSPASPPSDSGSASSTASVTDEELEAIAEELAADGDLDGPDADRDAESAGDDQATPSSDGDTDV